MKTILAGIGLLLVVATLLPFIRSPLRWIRIFDFPRLQIATLILITAIAYLFFLDPGSVFDILLMSALVAAFLWQAFRIFPYTSLAPVQVRPATRAARSCLRLVIANVLVTNRNAQALLRILREADPDVVLLVETDDWWDRALEPLGAGLPHAVRQPQDNGYGMILYSRLPLESPQVAFLVDEDIPSIHAGIRLPTGELLSFCGVHPVPPPLDDTVERNAEILLVGRRAKESPHPSVVAGDLNDVGWSATTRLFARISGLLDPRLGRGFFSSYNAKSRLIRWPLDYIFHDPAFTLRELRLLDAFGSDHFPVLVHLCYEPQAKAAHDIPTADGADRAEAARQIRNGIGHGKGGGG